MMQSAKTEGGGVSFHKHPKSITARVRVPFPCISHSGLLDCRRNAHHRSMPLLHVWFDLCHVIQQALPHHSMKPKPNRAEAPVCVLNCHGVPVIVQYAN